MNEPRSKPSLRGKDRAHLRALAHALSPLVQVGQDGVSDGVKGAVDVALEEHELIKVRFGQNFGGDRKAAGDEIANAVGADLTQSIGRIAVLFRPRDKDLPGKPRIQLPR